jgi:hypothetical protein
VPEPIRRPDVIRQECVVITTALEATLHRLEALRDKIVASHSEAIRNNLLEMSRQFIVSDLRAGEQLGFAQMRLMKQEVHVLASEAANRARKKLTTRQPWWHSEFLVDPVAQVGALMETFRSVDVSERAVLAVEVHVKYGNNPLNRSLLGRTIAEAEGFLGDMAPVLTSDWKFTKPEHARPESPEDRYSSPGYDPVVLEPFQTLTHLYKKHAFTGIPQFGYNVGVNIHYPDEANASVRDYESTVAESMALLQRIPELCRERKASHILHRWDSL